MPRTAIDITVPDLSGRRALVTGGSDGIGLEIAKRLAAAGAELVLPVRNLGKGQSAAAEIRAATPGATVVLESLDLSSLESVATLGEALRSEGAPIHVLVNNAGVMTPPTRQATADGHELQLATNHLGHVALVAHLLPLLQAGRARVTSQISVAASSGTINWEDLDWERSYDPMKAYRQSKIAFGLFGLELDRRSKALGWGITSNLSHPGVAPTSLLSARPELGRQRDTGAVRLIRALSKRGILAGTPRTAGLPALLAATSPDAEGGALYGPSGFQHMSGAPAQQQMYKPLRDVDEAQRVWLESERLTGVAFPAGQDGSQPSDRPVTRLPRPPAA
ncbi:SDR family oxidoreductase [Nocardioides sp. SYSU D00065]|uniref:SDR family oxidoreductase n=1 Tax=Nocardioides sp. SYSU D00065 TaxID=2817378 RepID=UPI001B3332FA|nr:SDR family oxidoreductase [Nocardioides sp. SYSU D00065]